jgi:hypothetical protein
MSRITRSYEPGLYFDNASCGSLNQVHHPQAKFFYYYPLLIISIYLCGSRQTKCNSGATLISIDIVVLSPYSSTMSLYNTFANKQS